MSRWTDFPTFHSQVMVFFYEKCIMHNQLPGLLHCSTCNMCDFRPGCIVKGKPSDRNDVHCSSESTSKSTATK